MEKLPHTYSARVHGTPGDSLHTEITHLPSMTLAPPQQFGGPGGQWSPEELLMASVASCLILSFRAIAKASRLDWLSIHCESEGSLENIENQVQFTRILSRVTLEIPAPDDRLKADGLAVVLGAVEIGDDDVRTGAEEGRTADAVLGAVVAQDDFNDRDGLILID